MLSNALSGYQMLNMVVKIYQSKGSQREKKPVSFALGPADL